MKVLIIDNHRIFPPLTGGPQRIVNLYNNLPKKYNLKYIGLSGYDYINNNKNNLKEKIIPIKKYIVKINDIITKLVTAHTFDVINYLFANINYKFIATIKDNAKRSDILIASHPWCFPFLTNFNKFLVYDAHNCEYLLRIKQLKKKKLGKIVLKIIEKIEKMACEKSNIILTCSKEDKNNFIKLYQLKKDKIYVIPNSINEKKIKVNKRKRKNEIVFIGAYYEPNNEALDFIIKELAPKLKNFKFNIIGSIKIHVEKEYYDKKIPSNVHCWGVVNDKKLNEIYNQSKLAINPMFNGSGFNIKMLDYMQAQLPIITTKVGARGIDLINQEDVIICESKMFATNIIKVNENKKLYNRLRKNGKKIVKKYNAKKVSKKLNEILKNEYINYIKFQTISN